MINAAKTLTKKVSTFAHIKGIVSQNEYFLQVLKIKTVLIDRFLVVFKSDCLCKENKKLSFLLASVKSLNKCENPSNIHLQGTCSGFPISACDSKSCSENVPEASHECTLEKSYQSTRAMRNFMRLLEQSLELISFSKKQAETIFFS